MKSSIFSRLMTYLSLFFLVLIGVSYLALSTYFESYYSQKRLDDLERRTHDIISHYDEKGIDGDLEALIEAYEEEGTVIQITKVNDPIAKRMVISRKMNPSASSKSSQGKGQGEGKADGTGKSQDPQGHHRGLSFEEQISNYEPGENFITLLESANQEVEWLTYKEVAADGTQVTGRIPLYSVNEVIEVVQGFLLVFLSLVFMVSLVFAYFFARGISRPIIELNKIAQGLGALDFSQVYQGKRADEVGQLGATLNIISQQLENTLTDLGAELSKEKTLEKMRQRFTATVSHEIQTPLAIIKSHAEGLEDDIPESQAERRDYYQIIQEESDKISAIASDLLDLAQIESGVYRLKKERIVVADFLKDILKTYQTTYPQLTLDHQGGETIRIDSHRMEQVFNNIIGNAIKHLAPKDGALVIDSQLDQEMWHLSIYNDGPTIADKDLSQIWDYFYMADSKKKGTGLGLAIAKGIISCHGGEAKVKNYQKGVAFLIDIPTKN